MLKWRSKRGQSAKIGSTQLEEQSTLGAHNLGSTQLKERTI